MSVNIDDPLDVQGLVAEYGTPLQVYDGDSIIDNITRFTEAAYVLPNFMNCFAVKALPNPHILELVLNQGFGLDCSSITELNIAQQLGVDHDMIVYSANYLSMEEFQTAVNRRVHIDLDDYEILNRTDRVPHKLSFRINPNMEEFSSDVMLSGAEAKFGISENDVLRSYELAVEKGVTEFGMHIMCGSNMLDSNYWTFLTQKMCDLVAKVQTHLGIEISEMNFGGGLGTPYCPEDEELDIEQVFLNIRQVLENKTAQHNIEFLDKQFIMEAGRYITGPYGYLITRCDSVKNREKKTFCGMDACMTNLMRPGMYGAYHKITVNGKNSSEDDIPHNVVGKLCENNDWFAKDRILPQVEVGDLLIIHNTGAHSHSMGFQYNGRLRAPEVLVQQCTPTLIRRRETIDDYLRTVMY